VEWYSKTAGSEQNLNISSMLKVDNILPVTDIRTLATEMVILRSVLLLVCVVT